MSKIIFLCVFLYSQLILSQEKSVEPFKDIEVQTQQKTKPSTPIYSTKNNPKSNGKIILNPLTYLPVREYQLKGIFIGIGKDDVYAIVSTDDIQDQVVTMGDILGKEKYKIFYIKKNKIIVGKNNDLDDKNTYTINLVD